MGIFKEIGKFVLLGPLGYANHRLSKKAGYKEGYSEAEELSVAEINEYRAKLQKLQEQREKTKEGFANIINNITNVEINENIFLKVASLFKGYTLFHVYVIVCITYCRYMSLQNNINEEDGNELKDILLGLVQSGFPEQLKKDISAVWASSDKSAILTEHKKYKKKLDTKLQVTFDETSLQIDEYIKSFIALGKETQDIKNVLGIAS
jgi:hypothetical protein